MWLDLITVILRSRSCCTPLVKVWRVGSEQGVVRTGFRKAEQLGDIRLLLGQRVAGCGEDMKKGK